MLLLLVVFEVFCESYHISCKGPLRAFAELLIKLKRLTHIYFLNLSIERTFQGQKQCIRVHITRVLTRLNPS